MKILKLGQMLGGSNTSGGAAGFSNEYSLAFDGVDDYVTMGDVGSTEYNAPFKLQVIIGGGRLLFQAVLIS